MASGISLAAEAINALHPPADLSSQQQPPSMATAIRRLLEEPQRSSNDCDHHSRAWSEWAKCALEKRNSTSYNMRSSLLLPSSPPAANELCARVFSSMLQAATAAEPSSTSVDAGPELYTSHLRLLSESVKITVAKEGVHHDDEMLFPTTFIRLCFHPVAALRRWAMDGVLRAIEELRFGRGRRSAAQGDAVKDPVAREDINRQAVLAWITVMQYVLLQEQLLRYLMWLRIEEENGAVGVPGHQDRCEGNDDEKGKRRKIIFWLAAVATDGARFVAALHRHVQGYQWPLKGAAPVEPADSQAVLPPPEMLSSVPHVLGNMSLEAIYIMSSLDDVKDVADALLQDTLPCPPLMRHGGVQDQFVRAWVHGLIVEAKATAKHLTSSSTCESSVVGGRSLLHYSWMRLRWTWQVGLHLPPYQGSKSSSTPQFSENLRDSLLKITLANLAQQHQVHTLVEESSTVRLASSSSTTAAAANEPLQQWRRRAAACAMSVCVLLSSFHHCGGLPRSYNSLVFHSAVVDQAQTARGGLVKLLACIDRIGISFNSATPVQLLAPQMLMHELLMVDISAAFRTRNPSTLGTSALWKVLPEMFCDRLVKKRDVDGALKILLALMWCFVPRRTTGSGNSTAGGVVDDLHIIYLSTSVASSRPAVSQYLLTCFSDLAAILESAETVQIVVQYIASSLRACHNEDFHPTSLPSTKLNGNTARNGDGVEAEVSPLLSIVDDERSSSIALTQMVGRAAWCLVRCADAKMRRVGEIFVRRVFAHGDVVAVAPVSFSSHPTDNSPGIVTRDLWRAEGAAFVWTLITDQPIVAEACPKSPVPRRLSDDEAVAEGAPDALIFDSTAVCVGTTIPPALTSIVRTQLTSWIEALSDAPLQVHDLSSPCPAGTYLTRLLWGASVVLDVINGALVPGSAQRRQFVMDVVVRLVQHQETAKPQPYPPQADEDVVRRSIIGCSILFQLFSKASLFDSATLLTAIMGTCRALHSTVAAHMTFTAASGRTKEAAGGADTRAIQQVRTRPPEDYGLPTKKQWLVAFHGTWKQLPAQDRMTLKAAAHDHDERQSFRWLGSLIEATKNAVNDAEKQRENAFAQFEREDEFIKARDEQRKKADADLLLVLEEHRKKEEEDRDRIAAERRNAQDREKQQQKPSKLDLLIEKSRVSVGRGPSSWGKRQREDDAEVLFVGAKQNPTTMRNEESEDEKKEGLMSGGDAPAHADALQQQYPGILPAACSLMHSGHAQLVAAPMPTVGGNAPPTIGNMRLMVASERRKAVPHCNASKAVLVRKLTEVALHTDVHGLIVAAMKQKEEVADDDNPADAEDDALSSLSSGSNSNVSVDDIIGPGGIFPQAPASSSSRSSSCAIDQIPSSFLPVVVDEGGSPIRPDSSMSSLVTWDHAKAYVSAFAPPLALELRLDICNCVREFLEGWKRAFRKKEGSSALVAVGALPAVLRRSPSRGGGAPSIPSAVSSASVGGAVLTLHLGSPQPTTSLSSSSIPSPLMQLSEGDTVLILVPSATHSAPLPSATHDLTRTPHRHTNAGQHNRLFQQTALRFGFAVGMVKELNYSDKTVVIQIAEHANTKDASMSLLTAGSSTGIFVVRLGTQVAQHGQMIVALHDVLFSKFRDVLLQPQHHSAVDSQAFLSEAAALQRVNGAPLTDAAATQAQQRTQLCGSLNEFQRTAVHAALHGFYNTTAPQSPVHAASPTVPPHSADSRPFGDPSEGSGAGGRFVLIEGPPGTGKTQTIHSVIAAVLREAPSSSQRILVCAPSNIAVDELLLRLKRSGVAGQDGRRYMPRLLRVGVRDSVHADLLDPSLPIFFDDVVSDAIRKDERLASSGGISAAEAKILRQKHKDTVLANAQVVCVTLGSVRQIVAHRITFDYVIIDEASQATEPQTILPLTMGCRRCVLVGDTRQLQPTILSSVAARGGFGRSLMSRLLISAYGSVKLRVQYRMAPAISGFPNDAFYGGSLVDAPEVRIVPRPLSIPVSSSMMRVPRLLLLDVKSSLMTTAFPSKTLCNIPEAHVVVEQLRNLRLLLGLTVTEFGARVGVITFYKGQQSMIRRLLTEDEGRAVSVDTVDGFQGKEKDIIFVSCVRGPSNDHRHLHKQHHQVPGGRGATEARALGFVSDPNRMNVALTRAKDYLFVAGHAATLASVDGPWRRFVAYAAQEGDFTVFRSGVDCARNLEKGTNVFDRYSSSHA